MVVESEAKKSQQGGSLFKKKKNIAKFKKAKARGRVRSRSPDSDGDNDGGDASDHQEEESAIEAIISAKKKRKLLNEALGKNRRGLDASLLLQSKSTTETEQDEVGKTINKDLTKRLQGNFSESGDTGNGSGDTVMQRKHRDAMEEYIRQNMRTQAIETNETTSKNPSNPKDMEAQLYAELASSAQSMSGKGPINDDVNVDKNETIEKEGDVGAGGAMLGGTGIAEVELSVEDRIKTARATQEAAAAREMARQGTQPVHAHGLVASSAGEDVLRSDVSGLGSSFSHNYRMHNQEWVAKKKQEEETEAEAARQLEKVDEGPAANQERMGFEAARRAARGEPVLSNKPGSGDVAGERQSKGYQQRSSDDRVFKSFIQKTRR